MVFYLQKTKMIISPHVVKKNKNIEKEELFCIKMYTEDIIFNKNMNTDNLSDNISFTERKYITIVQAGNNIIDYFTHNEILVNKKNKLGNILTKRLNNKAIEEKQKDLISFYQIKEKNIVDLGEINNKNPYKMIYKDNIKINKYNEIVITKGFDIDQIHFFFFNRVFVEDNMFFNFYLSDDGNSISIIFIEKGNDEIEILEDTIIFNDKYTIDIDIDKENRKINYVFRYYKKRGGKGKVLLKERFDFKDKGTIINYLTQTLMILDNKTDNANSNNLLMIDDFGHEEENKENIKGDIIIDDIFFKEKKEEKSFMEGIRLMQAYIVTKNYIEENII